MPMRSRVKSLVPVGYCCDTGTVRLGKPICDTASTSSPARACGVSGKLAVGAS